MTGMQTIEQSNLTKRPECVRWVE